MRKNSLIRKLCAQFFSLNDIFKKNRTGYSLLITKHYGTNPKKKAKDYRYVFKGVECRAQGVESCKFIIPKKGKE